MALADRSGRAAGSPSTRTRPTRRRRLHGRRHHPRVRGGAAPRSSGRRFRASTTRRSGRGTSSSTSSSLASTTTTSPTSRIPARIPAFDEVDTASAEPGPLRDRQPAARASGRREGSARGDRVARGRADVRLHAAAERSFGSSASRSSREDRARRGAPAPGPGSSSTSTAGCPTTRRPAGHRRRRDRRRERGTDYVNATWFAQPAGTTVRVRRILANSDQFRVAGGRRPRQVFPLDTQLNYDATAAPRAGGPLAADLQGLVLHGLPGGPAAAPAADAAPRLPVRRQPERHRDAARRERLADALARPFGRPRDGGRFRYDLPQ